MKVAIKELRERRGISQDTLADAIGVDRTTIVKYETGKSNPTRKLKELADYFGVTTDEILGRAPLKRGLLGDLDKKEGRSNLPKTDSMEATVQNIVRKILNEEEKKKIGILIPVLGTIAAGIPVEAVEDILDYEEIPESMAKQGKHFALRVKGRSMEPRLVEGDTVIVRKENDVNSGRIAVVLVGREDATLKKVNKSPEGITLIGYNALVYEPHFYSNKEIEELPIQILGEVVELRRKM